MWSMEQYENITQMVLVNIRPSVKKPIKTAAAIRFHVYKLWILNDFYLETSSTETNLTMTGSRNQWVRKTSVLRQKDVVSCDR